MYIMKHKVYKIITICIQFYVNYNIYIYSIQFFIILSTYIYNTNIYNHHRICWLDLCKRIDFKGLFISIFSLFSSNRSCYWKYNMKR